jgi:hypothetical protein
MSDSLIVKCYFCSLGLSQFDCIGVSGLGPMKYVCLVCTKTLVGVAVMRKQEENNRAIPGALARRSARRKRGGG